MIVPYEPQHLMAVRLQPQQTRDTFDGSVPEHGQAWSLVVDGRCYAVGGLYPASERMATAWAFIGRDAGPHFVRLVRAMRHKMHAAPWPVIRAGALHGFVAAHRLLHMLGFVKINAVAHYNTRVYEVFEWTRYEH